MTRGLGGVRKRGRIWWIHYQVDGRTRFESSGSTKRSDAVRLLHERNVRPRKGPLRFEDLRSGMIADYELSERRSLRWVKRCFKHLEVAFGGDRSDEITPDRIVLYASARKEAGAMPATIRKELAVLKRAFNLAAKAGRISSIPAFPTIEVHNARTGFFEEEDFERVLRHLAPHLRAPATWGFWTGWRRSEILDLQWSQVDLKAGTVRLDWTKNKKGRVLPYRELPQLVAVIKQQRESHDELLSRGTICPWVFHRDGRHITYIHQYWQKACIKAGVPGKRFHDFRRTAARRLVRAGVSEKVAMELLGHKTRTIFDRYNITAETDLVEGLAKVRKTTDCQDSVRENEARGGVDRADSGQGDPVTD